MTAHEIHALSGAYAVDALDDLERARFEEHLSACAECRAEVASLQDAAALFSTVSEVAPPSAMRAKILADIKTVRPLPPLVARLEAKRPRRRWANLVAAAAVLGVVGGGVAVWQQSDDNSARINDAAAEISRIKNADDVQQDSHNMVNGGTATVFRSASLNKAAVVTSDLKPAHPGRVYQLWLQNAAGVMVPAGFITGTGTQGEVLRGDAANAKAAAISDEPAAGSAEPTGPIITVIPFAQHST